MTVHCSPSEKTTRPLRPLSPAKLWLIVALNIGLAAYVFWAYRSAHDNQLPTQRNPMLQHLRQR